MDQCCNWMLHQCVSCLWHYDRDTFVTVRQSPLLESGLHTLTRSPLVYFSSARQCVLYRFSCMISYAFFEQFLLSQVAYALVSARLDYVNSILYGTSTKQITRLQWVLNAFPRVIVPNQPLGSSSLQLLKQLCWLLVVYGIKFKITTLTLKPWKLVYHFTLCPYASTRALRSSVSKLLQVPHTNLQFGLRCFLSICSHSLELAASQHSFL